MQHANPAQPGEERPRNLLFWQFMPPVKRWPLISGAILGLLTWAYDYDFFLNAGGAETPISRVILTATHARDAGPLVLIFWPLLVLAILGLALGFATSKLLAPPRNRPR
jgi:hypothetical protein